MSLSEKPRPSNLRPFSPEANGAFRTSFAQLALMARITRVEPGTGWPLAVFWPLSWSSPRNCDYESWLNMGTYGKIYTKHMGN